MEAFEESLWFSGPELAGLQVLALLGTTYWWAPHGVAAYQEMKCITL
jgi:hypothetical protein